MRTCTNRLAGDGEHTVADEMSEVRVKGLHRIEFVDAKGRSHQALLEIRYRRLTVWPPVAKQRHYPALRLTIRGVSRCALHVEVTVACSTRSPENRPHLKRSRALDT